MWDLFFWRLYERDYLKEINTTPYNSAIIHIFFERFFIPTYFFTKNC